MTLARIPLGDHDIVVRTGGAAADDVALQAAKDQLNTWGDGRLLIDGHVIQTSPLAFVGDISLGGVTPDAVLDCRCTASAFPISWNLSYNPLTQTTYSFSTACAFADYFTPVGTTFSDGDLVCMWSEDAITGHAAHNGLGAYQYPMEIHQVHEWDGVNGYAYTPDPIVDQMSTNALFCKMTPSKGVMVFDLQMVWGSDSVPGNYHRSLSFQNCSGVRIYNVRFPRNGPGQIWFRYCTDVEIDRMTMWGQNNTYGNGPGFEYDGTYGINAAIVNGFRVTASHLVGSRHAFTTEGVDCAIGSANDRRGTSLNCVIEGNTVLIPPVKLDDTPTWDERIGLNTHSEGYNVSFIGNHIHMSGAMNNVGIDCRSRAGTIRGNHIYGGYLSSIAKPRTQEGIWCSGKETIVEGNFIDRCSVGIRQVQDSTDREIYVVDGRIGRNTITNCRHAAIILAGDRAHVYKNVMVNCAYDTSNSPLRVGALIQVGTPTTKTVSSFSGTTVTTTTDHGMVVSHQVRFRDGVLPNELAEGTYYWVVEKTANTFKISATKGGTAITFTGSPSGTTYVDFTYLPPKDCIIEGNYGHKGSNLKFLSAMGLETDELKVIGNHALGYGDGVSIFDDRFGEAADMQGAWHHRNIVDGTPSPIDVRKYGATGDGVTDDTDALQAAIDAAAGGACYIPFGDYLHTTLNVTEPDTLIYGEGTLVKSGSTGAQLTIQDPRVKVHGITLDGNDVSKLGISIYDNSTDCEIIGVTIKDLAGSGSTMDGILFGDGCDNLLIQGCTIDSVEASDTSATRGIRGSGLTAPGTPIMGVRILNNVISNITPDTDGDGIVIQDWTATCSIVIQGNTFDTCAKRAIKVYSPGVTIQGNIGSLPSYNASDLPRCAIDILASDTTVTGNAFDFPDGADDACVIIGAGVNRVSVTGNKFYADSGHGSSTMEGVQCDTTGHGIVISGNAFGDKLRYGVYFSVACGGASVSGNHFAGCTNYVYYVTASSNVSIEGDSYYNCSGGMITGIASSGGRLSGKLRGWGNAAPTGGTYEVADIIYDYSPSASGNIGWVCISAGSPGTWKSFGTISS